MITVTCNYCGGVNHISNTDTISKQMGSTVTCEYCGSDNIEVVSK